MAATKAKARKAARKVEKKDVALSRAVVPLRDHPAVKAVGLASEVADQPPLYAICGGVIVAGLARGDARLLRAGARMLAAHALAIMAKNFVKRSVDRTRPDLLAEGRYRRGKGRRFESDYNSFPSGHSASAIAVARALSREYPGAAAPALGLASTLSAVQLLRSAHYASDIVAGASLGLLAEAAVDAAFGALHPDVA